MKMKILLAVIVLTGMTAIRALAQAPLFINYQGKLTDEFGLPMNNDPADPNDDRIDIRFEIFSADEDGTSLWGPENHSNVEVVNGLFSVLLGDPVVEEDAVTIVPGTAFPGATVFLEVRVTRTEPDGTVTEQTLSPRKDIVSVAYAIRAANADTVDGLHANEIVGETYTGDAPIVIDTTDRTISLDYSTDFDLDENNDLIIAEGVIVDAHVSDTADIDGTKVKEATITARGTVELATDGEDAANVVVQGNDGRLDDARTPAGDAGGDLSGQYPDPDIRTGVIVNDDINANANIAASKINEADPQVDDNITDNYVPRWDADVDQPDGTPDGQLVQGTIYDDPGTGFIGIGINSPSAKLEVAGNALISGANRLYFNDVGGEFILSDGNSLKLFAGSTIKLIPRGAAYLQLTDRTLSAIGKGVGFTIRAGQGAGDDLILESTTHTTKGDIILNPTGGNVGIGTTSPGNYRLNIQGGDLKIGTGDIHVPFGWHIYNDDHSEYNIEHTWNTTLGDHLYFQASVGQEKFTISDNRGFLFENGNLGIGTNDPKQSVHIASGGIMFPDDTVQTTAVVAAKCLWTKDGDDIYRPIGNVGIKTTDPWYALDVNGNARVSGLLQAKLIVSSITTPAGPFLELSAYPTYPMTVIVPAWYGFRVTDRGNDLINLNLDDGGNLDIRGVLHQGSDSRMKLDQEPLDYGLAEILKLEPKRYVRTDSIADAKTGIKGTQQKEDEEDIGLVAQEVYDVIPEAVRVPEDERRDTWGIAYSKVVTVLVKAVQEQQEQIDELKQEIAALKGQ